MNAPLAFALGMWLAYALSAPSKPWMQDHDLWLVYSRHMSARHRLYFFACVASFIAFYAVMAESLAQT